MKSESGIKLFATLTGNPISRRVIMSLNKQCETCGDNRLEVALELICRRSSGCLHKVQASRDTSRSIFLSRKPSFWYLRRGDQASLH